jgi:ribosome maturation factor RimP
MTTKDKVAKLESILETKAQAQGLELVAVELAGGRRSPVVRVLLDREGGIDIDALTSANHWIAETLEEHDPVSGPYTLEVSSPGIDRPLRKLADFDRFAGENVHIKTRVKSGRSAWTGTILRTQGETVVIDSDGEEVSIPFSDIDKARLKGVIDFGKGGTT